jgi:NADPH2:quinone reductase
VLGLDVCGTVDALGEGVSNVAVGDRVLYHGNMHKQHGGFAEYAIHDAETIVVVGSRDADAIALAASPCAAWTAYRALHDKLGISEQRSDANARLKLAIVGASGGVGSFAIQFAKLVGVGTIIAVCSKKNEAFVRDLGATHHVDYHSCDVSTEILKLTDGEGVELAMDCVGSATTKEVVKALKFDGKVIPIVSFAEGDLTVSAMCNRYLILFPHFVL